MEAFDFHVTFRWAKVDGQYSRDSSARRTGFTHKTEVVPDPHERCASTLGVIPMNAANLASILTVMPLLAMASDEFEIDTRTTDMRAAETRAAVNAAGGPENYIKALVREFSKHLPKQLDESTNLIGSAANGTQFSLMYRLQKNRTKEEFENAATGYQRYTTREICFSPEGRVLTNEFGVTYRYIYFNKVGKNVFAFNVDKAACDELQTPIQYRKGSR